LTGHLIKIKITDAYRRDDYPIGNFGKSY
jgi:hypothetical protein